MNKISKNIILIGMPGCGKSSIGEKLARSLNIEFCDIDLCIESKLNMTIPQIFKKGEIYFRRTESEVLETISKSYPQVIATGGGVVKDYRNIEILKQNGVIIYINRPLDQIVKDIDIKNRPLISDGIEKVYLLYEERHKLYESYSDIEILNDKSEAETVLKILKKTFADI